MTQDRFEWQKLAARLRQRIADGTYGIGELIPTVRQLIESEGRSDNTITRALAELADEGLIRGEVGIGTRVIAKPGATPPSTEERLAEAERELAEHRAFLEGLGLPPKD